MWKASTAAGVHARHTFAQKHLGGDVIRGPNQGVCQAPLVLLPGSLLQGLQPVPTATVRHVVPEVTGLHAVLPDMVPFAWELGVVREDNKTKSTFYYSAV